MQSTEHIPATLDEVVTEIASILARGYMRHHKARRFVRDSENQAVDVPQVAESEVLTEK